MPPTSLFATRADITALAVDAIVNAANSGLLPGGGVCGAIHRAAGPALARACAEVAPCPTGEARLTPGFALPARQVIHAVGPRWQGGDAQEAELLAAAYRSCLTVAAQHGCRTIAFPAISTGIYGFPLDQATQVAVSTVRTVVEEHPDAFDRIIFACFDDTTLDAYQRAGVSASVA